MNDNGRFNISIDKSDGPFELPPLPLWHMFVVTSSLMKMLTTRILFAGLPMDYPHAQIAMINYV